MPREDRPIPAAPCPTCQRSTKAWSGDVGRVILCRGCGTRFRIALTSEVGPIPDEDDENSEKDRRLHSAKETVYDAGYGHFEETVTPGRVVALAVMHFVYFGLLSVCGVLSSVLLKVYPSALPGPDVQPSNAVFFHIVHLVIVLGSTVMLIAGFKVLRRRPTARIWTIAAMSVAGVLLLLSVGVMILNLPVFTGRPLETFGVMTGLIYQLVFWLGYLAPVVALMSGVDRKT